MFRLIGLFVCMAFIAAFVAGIVWYVRTPQPIGPYAQWNYIKQSVVYHYYDYKKDPNADKLAYWMPLALHNNAIAQTDVAELYFASGQANPADYKIAVDYLTKAADQGLPEAQNALGVAYRNGLGVPMDKLESYKWFGLAARQGMDLAIQNLADVTFELTPKEQEEAKLRVGLWVNNFKKYW